MVYAFAFFFIKFTIMMKLKDVGRVEVKSLGIVLTKDSTEEELEMALKHRPELSSFIEGKKTATKTKLSEDVK